MRPPVIGPELAAELEQYKGRWVAVYQDRVIAADGSPAEVVRAARKQRVTDPLVFRVPVDPERLNVL